jgi:hypothetical protein
MFSSVKQIVKQILPTIYKKIQKRGNQFSGFPRLFPTIYNSCLRFPPLLNTTQNPVAARP